MAQATPRMITGGADAPDCELLGHASPATVRAPTYVARLLLGAAALLVGLIIAVLYEDAIAGLAYNQRLLLDAFPDVLQTLISSLGVYVLAAVVLITNGRLIRQRRPRTAVLLDLAAAAGAVASYGAGTVLERLSSSSTLDGFLAERLSGQSIPTISTSPILGATVAALVLGGPWLNAVAQRMVVDHGCLHRSGLRAVHLGLSRGVGGSRRGYRRRRAGGHRICHAQPGSHGTRSGRLVATARFDAGQPHTHDGEQPDLGAMAEPPGRRLRSGHQGAGPQPSCGRVAVTSVAAPPPEGAAASAASAPFGVRPTTRRWHRYKLTTWVFAHRASWPLGPPAPTA